MYNVQILIVFAHFYIFFVDHTEALTFFRANIEKAVEHLCKYMYIHVFLMNLY